MVRAKLWLLSVIGDAPRCVQDDQRREQEPSHTPIIEGHELPFQIQMGTPEPSGLRQPLRRDGENLAHLVRVLGDEAEFVVGEVELAMGGGGFVLLDPLSFLPRASSCFKIANMA